MATAVVFQYFVNTSHILHIDGPCLTFLPD